MGTKQSSVRRWFIGGVAALCITAGLVIGPADPAAADPLVSIVGVGSETTQDLWNQLAAAIGGGLIGSYDAVKPGCTPAGGAPAAICRQAVAIQQWGFAQLTTAPLGHTCGQVATDLRAFPTL